MFEKVLLALHRKDTKTLEEIFNQRPEALSCELEPDINIGDDYRTLVMNQNFSKFINNGWNATDGRPYFGMFFLANGLKVAEL